MQWEWSLNVIRIKYIYNGNWDLNKVRIKLGWNENEIQRWWKGDLNKIKLVSGIISKS